MLRYIKLFLKNQKDQYATPTDRTKAVRLIRLSKQAMRAQKSGKQCTKASCTVPKWTAAREIIERNERPNYRCIYWPLRMVPRVVLRYDVKPMMTKQLWQAIAEQSETCELLLIIML